MAQTVEPVAGYWEPAPNRKRWTRRDCESVRGANVLPERYELIDGDVISKMGQKPSHRLSLVLLHAWLAAVFGALYIQIQSPIDVGGADPDHNEPEPDAAVTAESNITYADRHPGPSDLALVVEVSDTTLRYDLLVKGALYSRAGIREYWVVDLSGRQVFVHRRPAAESYAEVISYGSDELVETVTRPDTLVRVSDLLPPIV